MASGGGAATKGSSSKGSSKDHVETITRTKKLATSGLDSNVLILRNALFEESGADKDVMASIVPFFKVYKKNGMNVRLDFSVKLTKKELTWAFDLCKHHMEQVYNDSEYGWDDEDKMKELKEDGARFILARDETTGKPVGFAHFRFTVQGEFLQQMAGATCLCVWDLHVDGALQRKGLGKHMLKVLELVASQQKMKFVSIPVQNACAMGLGFLDGVGGYVADVYLRELMQFDAEDEGFQVYSKELGVPTVKKPAAVTATVSTATPNKGQVEMTSTTTSNVFGFGDASPAEPAPASPGAGADVFGFGAAAALPAVTTPAKGNKGKGMGESGASPTSLLELVEGASLEDGVDRLAI